MITYIIIQTLIGIIASAFLIAGAYRNSARNNKYDRKGDLFSNIGLTIIALFLIDLVTLVVFLYVIPPQS